MHLWNCFNSTFKHILKHIILVLKHFHSYCPTVIFAWGVESGGEI